MSARWRVVVWLSILCAAPAVLAESIPGLHGGSYVLNMNGDVITSLTNDDGSVIQFQYDANGQQVGETIYVNGAVLDLQYASDALNGWAKAGSLPVLFYSKDDQGRTTGATLYPGMRMENGEWTLDVN